MDNKEHASATSAGNKLNLRQYKADIIYIAFLTTCLIMFPFGVIFYIWGRMNLMIHFLILITFALLPLIAILFFVGIVRFLIKNTRKKKILIFIEMLIPVLFFIVFFFPPDKKLNLYDSGHPFLCGYRDRIRSRLDIKAVREWMKTYSENYTDNEDNQSKNGYIPYNKLPDCLKPIRYGGAFIFGIQPDGNPIIQQNCGATFTHWGLTIGMEDMPFPDSQYFEEHGLFWMPVAPGIYVEMD
jgi:hypothetical protein